MPSYPLTGTAAADIEARLNIMRLAQTRLGFMNPTLRATVGGTDRTALIEKHSIRITRNIEGPTTATLTVKDFVPTEGQEIILAIGAITNRIFAGHITNVKQIADGLVSNVKYSLSCQDYTWLLDRRQVMKTYNPDNPESIIADLISTFTSGFTTTHVEQGLGFQSDVTPFTMELPSGCLRRLAQKCNANWHVDPFKDVHFYSTDRVPTPHDLTSSYKDYENVALAVDLSQVCTRVYVEGAGSAVSTTFLLSAAGTLELDTAIDFSTALTSLRVGSYAPINSGNLTYTTTSGGPPATQLLGFADFGGISNANFRAVFPTYVPSGTEVNMWVQVDDVTAQTAMAALEGGDGIRERYIQDRRLNKTSMTARGTAELSRYKNPVETLTYRTHDPNTRPGAKIVANLASPTSISGTFMIQTVTIADIERGFNRHPWYDVTATSTQRTLWDIYQDTLNKAPRI